MALLVVVDGDVVALVAPALLALEVSVDGATAANWTELSSEAVVAVVLMLTFFCIRPNSGRKLRMLAERITERSVRYRLRFAFAAIALPFECGSYLQG